MVQAKRVHRTQMPLNAIIITQRNDALRVPLGAQGESTCQDCSRLLALPIGWGKSCHHRPQETSIGSQQKYTHSLC